MVLLLGVFARGTTTERVIKIVTKTFRISSACLFHVNGKKFFGVCQKTTVKQGFFTHRQQQGDNQNFPQSEIFLFETLIARCGFECGW